MNLLLLLGKNNIPFYTWDWLTALENSGSISRQQGWQPLHLALWRGTEPIAVAPLYLKSHSFGEFIFDQMFVKLSKDLGLNYYPKLIGMRGRLLAQWLEPKWLRKHSNSHYTNNNNQYIVI